MAEEPVGGLPIALSPPTYARHDEVVRYVESEIRTRAPRKGIQRSPGAAWGTWGLLEAGGTITGAAGLILGEGEVKLCTQDGAELTVTDEVVPVVNSGAEITADVYYDEGVVLGLHWVNGIWSLTPPRVGGSTRVAKTRVGGIAAMTGTTPGSATVDLYNFDGASLTEDVPASAFNSFTTAIAGGTWIHVAEIQGYYFVSAEDC